MKKRIISFLLAMVLVLGLIPATATTANAYSTRNVSSDAIGILSGSMTFYAKETGNKIGYGTPTNNPKFDVDEYKNDINKDTAVDLMHNYIKKIVDKEINDWAKTNNIDLAQHEHDALVVNIYRGANTDVVFEAIRTIKTVNSAADRLAMVEAFVDSRSHTATSDEVLKPTLNLSMAEAAMYLYGDYGYNGGNKLVYTMLDKTGDKNPDDFVVFVKNDGYNLPVVTGSLGWFLYDAEKKDITGAPISKLTKDHAGKLMVAKKATGDNVDAEYTINTNTLKELNLYNYPSTGPVKRDEQLKNNTSFKVIYEFLQDTVDENGNPIQVKWIYGEGKNTNKKDTSGWIKVGKLEAAETIPEKPIAVATVTSSTLNIRKGATTDSDKFSTGLKKNDVVNIYEFKMEKTETGNQNWGKVMIDTNKDGYADIIGWINLAYTDVNETSGESGEAEGQTGKIANADNVNVRSSAVVGTNNWITSLKKGTKVTVLEMNDDRSWAKIKWSEPSNGYTQGWIYMQYVQLDSAYAGSNATTPETVKYTGVVNSNTLNVRKSADIYSTKVDTLSYGAKVNVYETKTSRNMKWGKIGSGRWVCLTYLDLTEVKQPAAGSATTTTTSLQATVTATVLNVLKNYNNNAEVLGTLKKGDVVTILEKNTEATGTGSRIWGRISKDGLAGWINLAYVELKTVTSVTGGNTNTSTGTTSSNGAAAVVANCISVNIREGAGVSNAQITKLKNGTAIKVYDRVTKDNAPWAKITWDNGEKTGWVCMNYVEMTTAGTTGTTTEGGLVNGTNSNTISATGIVNSNIDLNVRSVAGLNGIKLGALKKGTRVTVYEQVSADGMIWGRIPYGNGSGWICMSYITIESASSTGKGVMGTVARCFAAVNVRSAPGTNNALINKINVGSRVEVFETKQHGTQLWGRVAQGWVCMDYILLDSELPPGTALDATVPTTAPTQATEPQETINKDNEVGYTISGTVNGTGSINIRNDADINSDRVGTVNGGETVKVLALKQNGAELWGRIDQYATAGWIRMDKVNYSVHGYVNTDEQPVYANADTSSTVKEKLTINTELTITKLSVGGETVYGWVDSADGWIPMGRINNEPVEVTPVIKTGKSTTSFGSDVVIGNTNASSDIVNEINGSKVVFKVQSGVQVYVAEMRIESGVIWGKIKNDSTIGWINMAKVNYQLYNCAVSGNMNVRSSKVVMDEDAEPNNILGKVTGTITMCELSFDGDGNLWGKVTGNTDAAVNGGYIMVKPAGGNAYVTNTGVIY